MDYTGISISLYRIPTYNHTTVYAWFLQFFYNFLLQNANLLNKSLFIGEAKTQQQIAEPKIILSRDFKTTFKLA